MAGRRRASGPEGNDPARAGPGRDGVSAWRAVDICRLVRERFGVEYSENGMLRLMRVLGLSRQKTRPKHPQGDAAEVLPVSTGHGLQPEDLGAVLGLRLCPRPFRRWK
ncbi:helix-turn-helix domain-containing protein [Prosthecomicrobium sp. N25]|uniref:helix-turn-helix domain-containing protein n=1 Tax=Prosthecomicrobium sp. N25 TaxID=3129254 RepID=UPI003FCD856F